MSSIISQRTLDQQEFLARLIVKKELKRMIEIDVIEKVDQPTD